MFNLKTRLDITEKREFLNVLAMTFAKKVEFKNRLNLTRQIFSFLQNN